MSRRKNILNSLILLVSVSATGCVSTPAQKEGEVDPANAAPEPVSATPVAPAQISPEECVGYVQLERNADYQCELANGSTRPLAKGERRSTPLTREEIEGVIRRNKDETQSCFESFLPKDSKVEGKIYISFDIDSEGKVSSSQYNVGKSTYKDAKLGKCLAEKAQKWRFPVLRTDETLQINYPFQLISAEPLAPQGDSSPAQSPAKN